jgi:hypothetical protein
MVPASYCIIPGSHWTRTENGFSPVAAPAATYILSSRVKIFCLVHTNAINNAAHYAERNMRKCGGHVFCSSCNLFFTRQPVQQSFPLSEGKFGRHRVAPKQFSSGSGNPDTAPFRPAGFARQPPLRHGWIPDVLASLAAGFYRILRNMAGYPAG